jgi:hypothetical protein
VRLQLENYQFELRKAPGYDGVVARFVPTDGGFPVDVLVPSEHRQKLGGAIASGVVIETADAIPAMAVPGSRPKTFRAPR